jgi:hypothetical protein
MSDTQAGGPQAQLLDDAGIFRLLREARRTLLDAGYRCVPVNPNETEVEGVAAVASLAEAAEALGGPIDIVDVFRRSEQTVEVAREAVAVGAGALWLQLGIVNEEAARIAAAGGLKVVMDRCTAIEIRRIPRT